MSRKVGDIIKLKSSREVDESNRGLLAITGMDFDEGIECVIINIDVDDIENDNQPYQCVAKNDDNFATALGGKLWVSEVDILNE